MVLATGSHRSELSARGTYNWMAPEILVGGRCGFSSDIFSLGIVLYELASQVGTAGAQGCRSLFQPTPT